MMATAVFLAAFVIRMVLLPAVLELYGRRTWAFLRELEERRRLIAGLQAHLAGLVRSALAPPREALGAAR